MDATDDRQMVWFCKNKELGLISKCSSIPLFDTFSRDFRVAHLRGCILWLDRYPGQARTRRCVCMPPCSRREPNDGRAPMLHEQQSRRMMPRVNLLSAPSASSLAADSGLLDVRRCRRRSRLTRAA
jgi:hypothetical protein